MPKRKGAEKLHGGTNRKEVLSRTREAKVFKLRLEGANLEEIAAQLGYGSRSSVHKVLMRVMARMPPADDVKKLRAAEVARTYEVEQEAWEQWYRSTEDAMKETVKTCLADSEDDDAADGIEKERTTTREGQCGNPALLDKILKAMERRAKLLGLDAPEKSDVSFGVNLDLFGVDRQRLLEEHLQRLKEAKRNVGK